MVQRIIHIPNIKRTVLVHEYVKSLPRLSGIIGYLHKIMEKTLTNLL